MQEKIGKITLDYKYYPGEDFYCDGDVEDELLEIVKNHGQGEFWKIIEERAKWPVLYHIAAAGKHCGLDSHGQGCQSLGNRLRLRGDHGETGHEGGQCHLH